MLYDGVIDLVTLRGHDPYFSTMRILLVFFSLILLSLDGTAQIVPKQVYPATYMCQRTVDQIQIDGLNNEQTWVKAHPLSELVDIEGPDMPAPTLNTRVQMAWDDDYLYVFVEMQEPHLWATLENHDDIIWRDNDFELFFDPDMDTHNYMEFEYNVFGTLLDLYLVKPYRDGGPMLIEWDVKGVRSAVHVYGTINDGTDQDRGWNLEVAIPFQALKTHKGAKNPEAGTRWMLNFSRVQWDLDWTGEEYVKRKDAEGHQLPEHNWVWSPQGLINMHYPEKWGFMKFSDEPVGEEAEFIGWVHADASRIWLREVYYGQRLYYAENKKYASSLDEILQYHDAFQGVMQWLDFVKTPTGYQCTIKLNQTTEKWAIDETGKTQLVEK